MTGIGTAILTVMEPHCSEHLQDCQATKNPERIGQKTKNHGQFLSLGGAKCLKCAFKCCLNVVNFFIVSKKK
jgi:hypothetical protein